jgi:hypothetical protein
MLKQRLIAAGLAVGSVGMIWLASPNAHAAACDTGATRTTDASGNYNDTQATLPDGGQVYQNSGAVGVSGSHGYVEAAGSQSDPTSGYIQGSSTDAPVNGRVDGSGVCVNGTKAP